MGRKEKIKHGGFSGQDDLCEYDEFGDYDEFGGRNGNEKRRKAQLCTLCGKKAYNHLVNPETGIPVLLCARCLEQLEGTNAFKSKEK